MMQPPKTSKLPDGIVLEQPPFVPRMVMTNQLKAVVRGVISQWRHRERFAGLLQYGIRPLDRLLFFGPPGNGKTMACYWIARELGIPMYRVLCNQLHGSHLGETTRAVADVVAFLNAQTEPALCLWDECESIFVDRKVSASACDREIAASLTVFMQALDRWRSPVLLVLATNLIEQLDAALLSRVEMRLEFLGPTPEQCEQLITYWRELLCSHGADDWGPAIAERVKQERPESFRELQQAIAWAARDWTAQQIT